MKRLLTNKDLIKSVSGIITEMAPGMKPRNLQVIVDYVDKYIHGINCDRLEQNNYEDFVKDKVCELSCLSEDELYSYASDLAFSSIHITRLEVFDKPKALSEFKTRYYPQFAGMVKNETHYELRPVIRAPQSWQYIEVESSL